MTLSTIHHPSLTSSPHKDPKHICLSQEIGILSIHRKIKIYMTSGPKIKIYLVMLGHATRVDSMWSSRANSHQPNLCACEHHNWLTGHRLHYSAPCCGTCRDEQSGTWKGDAGMMIVIRLTLMIKVINIDDKVD